MSKTKVTIERQLGTYRWTATDADCGISRNGNCYARHDGHVYVWARFQDGIPVFSRVDGQWKRVGRMTRFREVFLGAGQSYREYQDSPEGLEASKKALMDLRAAHGEQVPPRGGLLSREVTPHG